MKNDFVYLKHILDSISRIESYIASGKDSFLSTPHLQDAVIRQLEIIGEATKHISQQTRDKHPNIPWKRIAGLRDILIHDYMGVDIDAVWEITQKNLSELKQAVQDLLA